MAHEIGKLLASQIAVRSCLTGTVKNLRGRAGKLKTPKKELLILTIQTQLNCMHG